MDPPVSELMNPPVSSDHAVTKATSSIKVDQNKYRICCAHVEVNSE